MQKKALLIDHNDSFIWNIKSWLEPEFNLSIVNHSTLNNLSENLKLLSQFELVLFSPGPKSPQDYPQSLQLLNSTLVPVLGICLGFQMMVLLTGGRVRIYTPPRHGKASRLQCKDLRFNQSLVGRYHSLSCEPNDELTILAYSEDDHCVMWAEHKVKKQMGFQFHPESFLTENADQYKKHILNWMNR